MPRRRATGSAFSLFSFQDIITSVTGIMILVTLMLAIELMSRTVSSPSNQTAQQIEATRETVDEMKKEIEKLRAQIARTTVPLDDIPSFDIDKLRRDQVTMEQKLEQLDQQNQKLARHVSAKKQELERRQREEMVRSHQEERRKEDLERQVESLREKIATLDDPDQTFFIVGKNQKPTWLIELTSHAIHAALIGTKSPPRRFASIDDVKSWIQSHSPGQYGYFFVVKPGGSLVFRQLQKFLIDQGYEFGFDIVGAQKKIIDPQRGVSPP